MSIQLHSELFTGHDTHFFSWDLPSVDFWRFNLAHGITTILPNVAQTYDKKQMSTFSDANAKPAFPRYVPNRVKKNINGVILFFIFLLGNEPLLSPIPSSAPPSDTSHTSSLHTPAPDHPHFPSEMLTYVYILFNALPLCVSNQHIAFIWGILPICDFASGTVGSLASINFLEAEALVAVTGLRPEKFFLVRDNVDRKGAVPRRMKS